MRPQLLIIAAWSFASLALAGALAGCEDKKPSETPAPAKAEGHGHDHGDGHAHDHDHERGGDDASRKAGHGGPVIALGEQNIGSFSASATRDEGQIVAGKDAPVDVTVTQTAGASAKVVAVRLWIGTEDARGSVKAKAEVENPEEPNRWHAHVEIPSPLPEASRLWVEIEDDQGGTSAGGFDLKA